MKNQVLTYDEIKAELIKICTEHPDRVNPFSAEQCVCLYTDPNDPDCHCIVGQVIFNLTGISIPSTVNCSSGGLLDPSYGFGFSWNDKTGYLLEKAQKFADSRSSNWEEPIVPTPWGIVLNRLGLA